MNYKRKSTSRSPKGRRTASKSPARSYLKERPVESRANVSKEQKSSSNCGKCFVWLSLFAVLIVGLGVCLNYYRPELITRFMYSKSPTCEDIIKQYKPNLPGVSGIVIESAIDKFLKNRRHLREPVVLLLQGNETTIRDLYLKLADILIENENDEHTKSPDTIFEMAELKAQHNTVVRTLQRSKMVMINGLENLKGKDYMELYGFVDGNDSHSTDCLIVISLNDELNRTEVDFAEVDSIERYVRNNLRRRWNDNNVNNLEAFLNRIISFVGLVL